MSRTMSHWIRAGCVLVALLLGLGGTPVQAKRVLFAAMDDWPPFIIDRVSLSSDSGFDGIDRELLQELSVRSGVEIRLLRYPFARALQDLQTGRVDRFRFPFSERGPAIFPASSPGLQVRLVWRYNRPCPHRDSVHGRLSWHGRSWR